MAAIGNTAPISMTFRLTVRNTRGAGTSEYTFTSGSLTVGRDVTCDVVLDSGRVSRSHASFSIRDGRLFVEDLGSANGTRVNERRISAARELLDDDVVRIGDFVITVSGNAPRPALFMRLKGISASNRDTVLEFTRTPSLVGRGEEAHVIVVHPSVSRRHCRVERRSDGSVLVSDLQSANGVRVNGTTVTVSQVLQGDTLTLGQIDFIVELPGQSTLDGMPAIIQRRSFLLRIVRSRAFPWIVVAALAAAAISIAGWTLGGIRREAVRDSVPLHVGEVAE